MEWSHDFCLSCDRQIAQSDHGAYCSQSCRLADLERASNGSPSSYSSTSSSSSSSSSRPHGGFYLPPALNFASMATSPRPSARSPTTASSSSNSSSSNGSPPASASYAGPQLYSSPSRASLSSLSNYAAHEQPAVLSDKVKHELREYAGSFDHIRDWKRRMTVV